MSTIEKYMVYYDGRCNLCHHFVRFVMRHDRRGVFSFDTLQRFEPASEGYQTVRLQKEGVWYEKSDAFFEIIDEFGGRWRLLSVFRVIPKSLRDGLYIWVAKNRYKWFGRRDSCAI